MSAALAAEIKENRPLHATFDLALDQNYKFANGPVASDSAGMYLDRVKSWGSWERSIDLDGHSLIIPTTSIVVEDIDRVLQKAIGGPSSRNVTGAASQIFWRSFDVDAADHYNVVDGLVSDWRKPGDRLFFFLVAPDVVSLTAETNHIRKYSDVEWPNIPKENIGLDGQVVYGQHRSAGIEGQTGMVKCTMVDEINLLWDASVGKLFDNTAAVKQIWHNGDDETANFTVQEILRANKWHTVLRDDRSGGAEAVATDTITIDVDGVETNGDGSSGAFITDPIEVLSHFLANFVYNDWEAVSPPTPIGRWHNAFTQAPLDQATFDETSAFLVDRGYETGRVLKSSDDPLSILTELCESVKVYPAYMSNLKLGMRAINHARTPYTDTNHLRQDLGEARSELLENSLSSMQKTRIFVNHLLRAADGTFFRHRRVEDSRRSIIIAKDQDFPFGKAKV